MRIRGVGGNVESVVGLLVRLRGSVGRGEGVVVDGDGGGHDSLAVGGDPVEAVVWDFGDEAVAAEFGELSADVGAAAFGLGGIGGRSVPEALLDVGVAEADDGVLAGHDGAEQGQVLVVDGVEAGVVSSPVASRSA